MSPTSLVERVQHEAKRAVREQPKAHPWLGFYRRGRFLSAIRTIDDLLMTLEVSTFTDQDFEILERHIRIVGNVLDIELSKLGADVDAADDRQELLAIRHRLAQALEGLEQGLAPNPARRPSDEQLMQTLAAGLTRANIPALNPSR